jgi:16S rRNA (cytidine1402-2'-O)-methyltransferase
MVFYESPHRIVKALQQFVEVFGADRPVAVCREISKLHEEVVRGTMADALAHFTENAPRGEFVIVVGGKED